MPVRFKGGGRLRSRDIARERGPDGRCRCAGNDTGGADGGGDATNVRVRRAVVVRGLVRGEELDRADCVVTPDGCLPDEDRRVLPCPTGWERTSARGQFPSGGGVRG